MIPVRQSTAVEIPIGPVLDADGVAFTGAVVGDFQVKKNGADWAALNGSATATHTAVGNYDLVLTTSDVDTVGIAAIRISDTVNACATIYLQVMEEAIYDALYAASANTFTGAAGSNAVRLVDLVTTTTTATNLTNLPTIPANWLTAAGTAADFGTEMRTVLHGGDWAADMDSNGRMRIVDGTGTGELDTLSGTVLLRSANEQVLADWVNGGRLDLILDTIAADVAGLDGDAMRGTDDAALATTLAALVTTVGVAGAGLTAADDAVIAAIAALNNITAASVWSVGTRTLTALGFTLDSDDTDSTYIEEIRNAITGGNYALSTDANGMVRIADGTGTGELDTASGTVLLRAATEAQIDAIEADTNELQGDWADGGRLDLILDARASQTSVTNLLTTALPESYTANGAEGNATQLLYDIHQMLMQFGPITGTSLPVKKLDNSTTAFICTLDDATNPTEISRS